MIVAQRQPGKLNNKPGNPLYDQLKNIKGTFWKIRMLIEQSHANEAFLVSFVGNIIEGGA